MTTHAIGDRVRTLTNLDSADWDPAQPDVPAGSLGTITGLPTANSDNYHVLLDADVYRLGVALAPHQIADA